MFSFLKQKKIELNLPDLPNANSINDSENNISFVSKPFFFNSIENFILKDNIKYDNKINLNFKDYSREFLDKKIKLLNNNNNNNTDNNKYLFEHYENVKFGDENLGLKDNNVRVDLFKVSPGNVGREFNKSPSIKYSQDKELKYSDSIFQILNGSGIVLLEKKDSTENTIKIIHINNNEIVVCPKNYNFIFINTNINSNLVILALTNIENRTSYSTLKYNFGASLYYTNRGFLRNKNAMPHYFLEEFHHSYFSNQNSNLFLDETGVIKNIFDESLINPKLSELIL